MLCIALCCIVVVGSLSREICGGQSVFCTVLYTRGRPHMSQAFASHMYTVHTLHERFPQPEFPLSESHIIQGSSMHASP